MLRPHAPKNGNPALGAHSHSTLMAPHGTTTAQTLPDGELPGGHSPDSLLPAV